MKRRRSEWAKIVAEVERGASASAVAERHGVNVKTLKWWSGELRRELRAAPRILPVVVPPTRSPAGRVEVVVGAFIIRVEGDSDLELVAKLASRLRDVRRQRGCRRSSRGLYSLVASCEANGKNPVAYLTDVLLRIGRPRQTVDALLPDRWKPS